jgi:exosortase A-associated hydrolase 1
MSAYTETAIAFDCHGSTLLGIVAAPPPGHARSDTAVLVVVGGPQYRAGSHRQFVQLSRALAAAGHSVLRFDVRGMGDSHGEPAGFEAVSDDIAAAIGALQAHAPQARRVALFGLCDGASAALLYMHDTGDARVGAICLLNPWVRTQETLARTHVRHYYLQRLASREFWRKLLTGGVGKRALGDFAGAVRRSRQTALPSQAAATAGRRDAHFRDAMRSGCDAFNGPLLLALSGDDLTAKEFSDSVAADSIWRKLLKRNGTQSMTLPGADHTLSNPGAQRSFEAEMVQWLSKAERRPASTPTHQ